MANLIGQSLGRYHILEQLGEGGMAVVYKAYDTRLETYVAVKVIRTDELRSKLLEHALKRFDREAKALAKLNHANIVKVIDFGECDDSPYLVMPYISGGTLKHKLTGKPMPWQDAAKILLPLARALDYAHRQGMIHRDVKPSNILLTDDGDPLLTDFGIAKIIDQEITLDITGTSATVGTPEYMAPEQVISKSVDHRADIYALGVVFYEMLTGRKLYTADTPMAVLFKHASEPLPHPTQFVRDLPAQVEQVLFKALAKKPEDRYQSMAEFANTLELLLSGSAIHAKSQIVHPLPKSLKRIRTTAKFNLRLVGGIAGGFLVLGFLVWSGSRLLTYRPTSTIEVTRTFLPTRAFTSQPSPTATASPTKTPIPPTPTLGIGSTMAGEDGMTMVYVSAGEFTMGSGGGDEKPIHKVKLDAFWIDQTEVTNKLFAAFITATGYQTDAERLGLSFVFNGFNISNGVYETASNGADWQHPTGPGSNILGKENFPVINVSWNDAVAYCEWAGRRLPTEAEWEKAASGEDHNSYPWGNELPNHNLSNFGNDVGHTTEVGHYPAGASSYGVHDMAGNAEEWVNDWYQIGYYATLGDMASNPPGPTNGDGKVVRGGSWLSSGPYIRTAQRGELNPNRSSNYMGFRCARSTKQP